MGDYPLPRAAGFQGRWVSNPSHRGHAGPLVCKAIALRACIAALADAESLSLAGCRWIAPKPPERNRSLPSADKSRAGSTPPQRKRRSAKSWPRSTRAI